MPSLATRPRHVMKTGNVSSVDIFRVANLVTSVPRCQGKWSKKSAKNRGSQWYAQSVHLDQTDHKNGKSGFCERFQGGPSIQIWA